MSRKAVNENHEKESEVVAKEIEVSTVKEQVTEKIVAAAKKVGIGGTETMALDPNKKVKVHIYLGYYPQDFYVECYLKDTYWNKKYTKAEWDEKVELFLITPLG